MINVTRKGRSGLPWWLSGKNPKGNQSWISTGRTDTEVEAPVLCPSDVKIWLTGKEWGRLKAGEEDDGGWHGWMASVTWGTWVWARSGNWWRTGKPGVL